MAWFEHSGGRIYYEDEGAGEAILLLPGWGGSIEEFTPLRQALARSYRVIAVDLPGSGRSGPQPREYTATYFQDDARSFIALLERLAVAPAHLIGFSDGGEYSLLMAALRPDIARSIVTWGAAGKLVEPMPGMLDAFFNLVDDPIEPMREFSEYLKAAYGEANARVMVQSESKALRAIIEAGGDISRSRAGEITCPALLITGEEDFLAPPPLVAETAAAIAHGEFIEVKGAGHDIHASHAEWLTQTVAKWLSRVGSVEVRSSR